MIKQSVYKYLGFLFEELRNEEGTPILSMVKEIHISSSTYAKLKKGRLFTSLPL